MPKQISVVLCRHHGGGVADAFDLSRQCRRAHTFSDAAIDIIGNLRRYVGWAEYAERGRQGEARKARLLHRWEVRKERIAFLAGDYERPKRSRLDERQRGRRGAEVELQATTQEVGDHACATRVGDADDIDAGDRLEQFRDQLRAGALREADV